jgi:hypothetical protein
MLTSAACWKGRSGSGDSSGVSWIGGDGSGEKTGAAR